MNDRALRHIVASLGGVANGYPREAGFDITVASEVMAILCLGMKGGAAGGGYAQFVPMEDINLHFHRRFPRHHLGAQPALRPDRQPHLLGERAEH